MPAASSSLAAAGASVLDLASILTRISFEEVPVGREVRDWDEADEGSRTAAMTVVLGRERKTWR